MSSMEARQASPFFKIAMKIQTFLLRRNWMGSAGNILMVITTTGRKSGKQFSTPIGYVRDGDSILAFTIGGRSNWYKNTLVNPNVTLNIKGKNYAMRAQPIKDEAEALQALEVYKRQAPNIMERFFGIPATSEGRDLLKALDKVVLIRFVPRET